MKITVLPGDGAGVEVTHEAVKVLRSVADVHGFLIETDEQLIGGAAIRGAGSPLPDATRDSCAAVDAVLLGAVGAPEVDILRFIGREGEARRKFWLRLGRFQTDGQLRLDVEFAVIKTAQSFESLGAGCRIVVEEALSCLGNGALWTATSLFHGYSALSLARTNNIEVSSKARAPQSRSERF